MQGKTVVQKNSAEKHFLRLYRMVREREAYLSDEAKIVQYGAVLRYFMRFLQLKEPYSETICSVLYQIDLRLGDIYCNDALHGQNNGRYFLAAEYYNQALLYAKKPEEKNRILSALKNIYLYLDDEDALVRLEKARAENYDAEDKFSVYVRLAQNTENPYIKAEFLAKALDFVTYQDKNFYAKYQDTLDVCSRLTVLYELIGEKNKATRVSQLREKTLKLLN
jgi:hypothetical protein